jgi:hypothetical protein
MAWELGFDFVDAQHCHRYLGHEFLSAHTPAKEIMAVDSKTARAFCGRLLREFIRLPPDSRSGYEFRRSIRCHSAPIPSCRLRKGWDQESRSRIRTCCHIAGVLA